MDVGRPTTNLGLKFIHTRVAILLLPPSELKGKLSLHLRLRLHLHKAKEETAFAFFSPPTPYTYTQKNHFIFPTSHWIQYLHAVHKDKKTFLFSLLIRVLSAKLQKYLGVQCWKLIHLTTTPKLSLASVLFWLDSTPLRDPRFLSLSNYSFRSVEFLI